MKVLVCGSRTWRDIGKMRTRLRVLPAGTLVIHGDAKRGADRWAGYLALTFGLPVQTFPAQWKRDGKRAGILRNIVMLDQCPDLVIAFWDGESRGTAHTIDEAQRRGIPVEVIR